METALKEKSSMYNTLCMIIFIYRVFFLMSLLIVFFFFTVAPKIDRKNLRDITVRENEAFHFDVKIIGEPPPDVTWLLNSKSIQQTTFRRIQNVPYNSKFFNDKPERKDTGIYKITAINQYGSDTAEVEVTVVCKYSFVLLFKIIYCPFIVCSNVSLLLIK